MHTGAVRAFNGAHQKLTAAAWAVRDGIFFALSGGREIFRIQVAAGFDLVEADVELLGSSPTDRLRSSLIGDFVLEWILQVEDEGTHKLLLARSSQHARDN